MTRKILKSDAESRQQLTPEQYHVTREKGAEPAFSGAYWDNHQPGLYRCVCCWAELFRGGRQGITEEGLRAARIAGPERTRHEMDGRPL